MRAWPLLELQRWRKLARCGLSPLMEHERKRVLGFFLALEQGHGLGPFLEQCRRSGPGLLLELDGSRGLSHSSSCRGCLGLATNRKGREILPPGPILERCRMSESGLLLELEGSRGLSHSSSCRECLGLAKNWKGREILSLAPSRSWREGVGLGPF